jgi:hypothetical protein
MEAACADTPARSGVAATTARIILCSIFYSMIKRHDYSCRGRFMEDVEAGKSDTRHSA